VNEPGHRDPFADLHDPWVVEVGVGEVAITAHPHYLMTPALGSCVAVAIYDPVLKRGALAHVMLPTPPGRMEPGSEDRFASIVVPKMARCLAEGGSHRNRMVAKIAGGAAMFKPEAGLAGIGERNIHEVRRQLALLKIPILAEDTGERHARTVELRLDSGVFVVRSYAFGVTKL
jgi:chemotaxis protein CheD